MKLRNLICFSLLVLCLGFISAQSYRDSWQQPEKVMDVLGIKSGMVIGEIGAGEGYFTFHLSNRVGNSGKVFANDIDKKSLSEIVRKSKEKNIRNIQTIIGELTDPKFPSKDLDMLVMMYVFHDLEKPVEYLKTCKKYLEKNKRIVIIDRDPDKFGSDYDHFWKKDKVLRLIKKAGYKLDRIETFLSRDNIYIIKK